MVIKNRKKFVRSLLLIIGIVVVINFIFIGRTLSHEETKYKIVAVAEGDTLWDIAEKEKKGNAYYKSNDIRDIIESIKKINNLENSSLKINQYLEIPTY